MRMLITRELCYYSLAIYKCPAQARDDVGSSEDSEFIFLARDHSQVAGGGAYSPRASLPAPYPVSERDIYHVARL